MSESICKECGASVPMYGYSHTTGVLREDWKCDCGEEWSIRNGVDTRVEFVNAMEGLTIYSHDDGVEMAAKIKSLEAHIASLPQLEPQWISVDDRLPEDNDTVIIRGGCGYWIEKENQWYTCLSQTYDGFNAPIQWDVTEWQHLPEPSK